jgi:CBS-domain-containing membrane protein
MAMVFVVVGLLFQQWMLLFIALFVYLGAQGEAQAAEMNSIFRNVLVNDAMTTRFQTLSPTDSLQRAADELLAGHQQDFPVVDAGKLVGVLRRGDLLSAIKSRGPEEPIGPVMSTQCPRVAAFDRLDRAVAIMHELGCNVLPVERDGRLVGMLTAENLGEWAMIHSALRDWLPARNAGHEPIMAELVSPDTAAAPEELPLLPSSRSDV